MFVMVNTRVSNGQCCLYYSQSELLSALCMDDPRYMDACLIAVSFAFPPTPRWSKHMWERSLRFNKTDLLIKLKAEKDGRKATHCLTITELDPSSSEVLRVPLKTKFEPPPESFSSFVRAYGPSFVSVSVFFLRIYLRTNF